MPHQHIDLISASAFASARAELGGQFARILGYFREDGEKSVAAVEKAFRTRSAVALVTPAHTLKGEAAQFGAHRLSAIAEEIERIARRCIESHQSPEELIETIVALRPCFSQTMALLEEDFAPPPPRRVVAFGRKVDPSKQGFGRAI
ncbi:MAG: Hpt domain-containing protein [Sphingobium sp.]